MTEREIPLFDEGAKYDSDKPDITFVFEYFPRALLEVARVAEFGAQKYARGNWVHVKDNQRRYEAALGRHLLNKYIEGDNDKDSSLLHLAHSAWNALAVLELKLRDVQERD
jgi:hypothetical protein